MPEYYSIGAGREDLVSLEDFNNNRRRLWREANSPAPRPNGIACPRCGDELYDSNPMVTLTTNPPRKNIHCENEDCHYTGHRIC